jgi:hypothetical protein
MFTLVTYNCTGNTKGEKYHCTIDLLFDWFGIICITTYNFYFYLQNRLIQTSQTGGQWYSDTSPFSIPWSVAK